MARSTNLNPGSSSGQARACPLRLALVASSEAVRLAAQQAAESKGWALDTYPVFREAIEPLRAARPDIALVDTRSSVRSAIQFVLGLRALLPDLPIIMLAGAADTHVVRESVMAGASGFLVEPVWPRDLIRAIGSAVQGAPALCPEAQSALVDWLWRVGKECSLGTLSMRERQVVACLLEKLSDKQIGMRLGIETATVHSYLRRISGKLEVHSRHEMVQKLFGAGLPAR